MDAAKRETIRRRYVGDIGKALNERYGPVLPDDDAGREDLLELLKPISLGPRAAERMALAIELRAPWMAAEEAESITAYVISLSKSERWPDGKAIGEALRLTNDERERYRLWMIVPCDVSAEELAEQKKAKERVRKAAYRRKKGAQSRKHYLANTLSRTEPWLAEGISRRTWYRRRAMARLRPQCSKPLQETVTP